MLEIKNLTGGLDGKEILKGVSLTVNKGEVHSIMGPNGSGKSTLSKILAGHPGYEVTGGSVTFDGQNLLDKEPEERALGGLFLAYQYPVEVPGVSNAEFLRTAYNARQKYLGAEELDPLDFDELLEEKMKFLGMDRKFAERSVNEGFSGGEKKKNEVLQMATLAPKLMVLDEIDSGLDIDALKVVADGVNQLMNSDSAQVVITHYQRLLDYIKPDVIHVFLDGRIVKTGDASLALELEEHGYDRFLTEAAG